MKRNLFTTMLTITTSIFLTLGCEKSEPVPELPYEDVFGSWDWYSTTGWQVTTYADSVDYYQILDVTRQGDYLWKQNDSLLREEAFTVATDTLEGNQIFYFRFQDSPHADQTFYIKNQDTLILTDQCADCDTYKFLRR